MLGIIGGSGFEKFDGFEVVEVLDRETPFGLAASGFKRVHINGVECLFMSRHGEHHENLPTEVNYRANVFAFKKAGATAIVSFSAVGSLVAECAPGDLVVPSQYIDRTKGLRPFTFLGKGLVGHVSLAEPVCQIMTEVLKGLTASVSYPVHYNKTYVVVEGPYFSTKAESHSYRAMNGHIIGMTHFPEYGLAREAGLPYLPCCFVTDYDCWDDSRPHVTVSEVIQIMKQNNVKAFELLKRIVVSPMPLQKSAALEGGLRTGLFMAPEMIPSAYRDWLEVLTRVNLS